MIRDGPTQLICAINSNSADSVSIYFSKSKVNLNQFQKNVKFFLTKSSKVNMSVMSLESIM